MIAFISVHFSSSIDI